MDSKRRSLGGGDVSDGSELDAHACSGDSYSPPSSSPASSASSSIGKNSDLSEGSSEDCEDNEAQSSYKAPLLAMDALEEVLPIRRGISKFYAGKSKSFTSLEEAATNCSIKEITKPENAYTRRRRNLMAFNQGWDPKNRSFSGFPLRGNGGGISKRPISTSRSTLAFAVAMTSSESSCSTASDESCPRSPPPQLPPLHPNARPSLNGNRGPKNPVSPPRHIFCSSRSMSLADFQQ